MLSLNMISIKSVNARPVINPVLITTPAIIAAQQAGRLASQRAREEQEKEKLLNELENLSDDEREQLFIDLEERINDELKESQQLELKENTEQSERENNSSTPTRVMGAVFAITLIALIILVVRLVFTSVI